MIKGLPRPTNNAKQFYRQGKETNLSANTSQNFALVCMKLLGTTDSTFHHLSFVSVL